MVGFAISIGRRLKRGISLGRQLQEKRGHADTVVALVDNQWPGRDGLVPASTDLGRERVDHGGVPTEVGHVGLVHDDHARRTRQATGRTPLAVSALCRVPRPRQADGALPHQRKLSGLAQDVEPVAELDRRVSIVPGSGLRQLRRPRTGLRRAVVLVDAHWRHIVAGVWRSAEALVSTALCPAQNWCGQD